MLRSATYLHYHSHYYLLYNFPYLCYTYTPSQNILYFIILLFFFISQIGEKATNISRKAEISKELAKKGEELAKKMNVCNLLDIEKDNFHKQESIFESVLLIGLVFIHKTVLLFLFILKIWSTIYCIDFLKHLL